MTSPHPRRPSRAVVLVIASILLVVGLGAAIEPVRWRVHVIAMQATGRLEGLRWGELLEMLEPGSPFYLKALSNTPNAYAVIVNPYTADADRADGERLFQVWCAGCHGTDGSGQTAPSLIGRTLKAGDSDWSLFHTVTEGRLELGMPPVPVDSEEAWQIVGHVRNLRNGSALPDEHSESARALKHVNVPSSRIEAAGAEPQNWLTYSGSYASWRYSPLDEITTENVGGLKLAWALQLGTSEEYVESSPLVVDGIVYVTAPPSDVLAVNAATGELLWRYAKEVPKGVSLCCGSINRGVAVLGTRVFVTTLDNHVVALDARTGKVLWDVEAANYKDGYTMTAAPLAVRDKLIVGVAGGDFGGRGFLDGYDTETGARAWRFETIPEPGQPGSETWKGDAWKTGGGPTWLTGSFDPMLGLLYWGVGNPAPDFNGDARPGDNLYTNSVLALDPDTGDLKWHFQFTPHDEHDWDANQIPVLVDRDFHGSPRRLMLWANRNGFYYVLDRATGEFLHASAFVKQNWAQGMDERGRPILLPSAEPSPRGTLTWPGLSGGGNWWSPAYSPRSGLFYVPFADAPKVFFKNSDFGETEPTPGVQFLGSASVPTGEPLAAGVRALDPETGDVAWEYLRRRPQRNIGRIGGVLASAGDLVFFGDLFDFTAFDAKRGQELWRVNLGGHINASPVSFAVDGHQRVAILAGNTVYVFGL